MSGTRFARSGRCRFFVCLGVFVIMVLFVAIFHSSQLQLDETREQRLRCEQQQEGLNEQVQTMMEQKIILDKKQEQERKDHSEARHGLEQKLKEAKEQREKEQVTTRVRYDKLEQIFKLLQVKHDELEADCVRIKKRHSEDTISSEKKLQALRSELQKDKQVQAGEVSVWQEKYKVLLHEKERLESLLAGKDNAAHIASLQTLVTEYKQHCTYIPKTQVIPVPQLQQQQQLQINKPLYAPETTRNTVSRQPHSIDKPHNGKSFSEQVQVSPGLYRIGVNLTNNNTNDTQIILTLNSNHTKILNATVASLFGAATNLETMQHLLPFGARNNNSLILNSVENFQIVQKSLNKPNTEHDTHEQQPEAVGAAPMPAAALVSEKMVSPLSAPRKRTSTDATKLGELQQAPNAPTISSSSGLPPLALPPQKAAAASATAERKLPENVAPIPENFEDLAQGNKIDDLADDTAAEDLPKNEDDDDEGKNNRYAMVVKDLETVKQQKANIEDSGAHEVKDHDFLNEQNFNLPVAADNHFFEGAAVGPAADKRADVQLPVGDNNNNNNDDDDDDVLLANDGDVAVKPAQHLLDADNLNNEIAGDHGKEFADGLRLDDVNEEDQDEDDYSNLAARKQGAEAIRN